MCVGTFNTMSDIFTFSNMSAAFLNFDSTTLMVLRKITERSLSVGLCSGTVYSAALVYSWVIYFLTVYQPVMTVCNFCMAGPNNPVPAKTAILRASCVVGWVKACLDGEEVEV